jgi:hypothetical protein
MYELTMLGKLWWKRKMKGWSGKCGKTTMQLSIKQLTNFIFEIITLNFQITCIFNKNIVP